jgi:hypothetical protein
MHERCPPDLVANADSGEGVSAFREHRIPKLMDD